MTKTIQRECPCRDSGGLLRWAPGLTLCLLMGPVLAGLVGTLLPAFGYCPPLGRADWTLEPWRELAELPGLWTSVRLSFVTGIMTTAVSLAIVAGFSAAWHGTRIFTSLQKLLAPLLSVPHVAAALGIAFLLAPSGWILRLLSPWATGFKQPPDWLILQDPAGLTLMLGLVVKEVPFLFVMTLAALAQVDAERCRTVALTLGYRPMCGWFKTVFPRVYPQIRLPVFAVLAYAVSVVDVAIVLAPTTPAPLAVRLAQLFNDADLSHRFVASAGAFLQLGILLAGVLLWLAGEKVVSRLGADWIASGHRGWREFVPRWIATAAMAAVAAAVLAGLLSLAVWSIADTWRFPNALPSGLTLGVWTRHLAALQEPLLNTLGVAVVASLLAILAAIAVLEHEARCGKRSAASGIGMLYLPLLIPQVAFLFGAQIVLVIARLDGSWIALMWMHLVFVFPYVFLALSDPYRVWDERYNRVGLCLGATPNRVLMWIKLPMLLRAIVTAAAIGFAVSVGQYLPTLFAGSGRYPTLTTEAVTLSSSGDLRLIGVYAVTQAVLPFLAYLIAVVLPDRLFRNRRGMQISS